MAYFRCSLGGGSGNGAVITVTYGAEFYNQTLVATNGTDTVSVLASSSGTADIAVPSEGSWVISCTIGADTYTSDPVSVDLSYEATITAIPDGSTVLPTDDIQTWLECAGITDKAYTTLAEVLADTDTYTTLLGDSNACDYMARSTTWSTDIVADADAMRLLGMYDYACDALLSDSTWASAIANSTYFESVLNVKVPTMTSNTAPSGTVICSSEKTSSQRYAWKAFDRVKEYNIGAGDKWVATGATNQYIGYIFTSPTVVKKIYLLPDSDGANSCAKDIKIEGSNDGSTWVTLDTRTLETQSTPTDIYFTIDNDTAYTSYRVYVSNMYVTTSGVNIALRCVQFYGRHTAQTDIIHSAPSDTIYYMDNGSPVTLCTTDASGVGTVDWSTLPTGDITLYSSIAKNPTDLTADYSKTIKVTKNKVEAYLMPDGVLYWYGYELYPLVAQAVSGGSSSIYTGKLPTLTRNTNNFFTGFSSSQTGTNQGTVYINHATDLTPFSKKKIIFDAVVISGVYRALYEYSSPSYSTGSQSSAIGSSSFTPSSATSNRFLQDVDISGNTSTVYEIFVTEAASGSGAGYSNCTVSAVWYE